MKCLNCFVAACLLVVSLCACSKKEATATAPDTSPEPAPAQQATPVAAPQSPQSPAVAAQVAQIENNVSAALKQQNYDAAVDALVQAKAASQEMSLAQRRQYAQQFQNTMDALTQAMATDPKAKAAHDRLGRAATGR